MVRRGFVQYRCQSHSFNGVDDSGLPLAALCMHYGNIDLIHWFCSRCISRAAGGGVLFLSLCGWKPVWCRFYFEALGALLSGSTCGGSNTATGNRCRKMGTLILILIWTAVLVLFVNFANFYNQIEQRIRIFEYTKHLKNAVVCSWGSQW